MLTLIIRCAIQIGFLVSAKQTKNQVVPITIGSGKWAVVLKTFEGAYMLLILCNFVEHMLLVCLKIPVDTGIFLFSSIKVADILTVLTVLKIAKGWLQYLFTIQFGQVVKVVGHCEKYVLW